MAVFIPRPPSRHITRCQLLPKNHRRLLNCFSVKLHTPHLYLSFLAKLFALLAAAINGCSIEVFEKKLVGNVIWLTHITGNQGIGQGKEAKLVFKIWHGNTSRVDIMRIFRLFLFLSFYIWVMITFLCLLYHTNNE